MVKSIKDLEGSFPVDGDESPISHEKIHKIDAAKWPQMNASQLLDQRLLLSNRLDAARSSGAGVSIQNQIQLGIQRLNGLIAQQQKNDTIDLI